MTLIFVGSVLLLVASVVGVVVTLGGRLGLDTITTNSSGSGVGIQFSGVFVALVIATALVELIVIVFTWRAFQKLATFDSRFSTPAKLSLLLAIAVALVTVIIYPLLIQLNDSLTCIQNAQNSSNTTALSGCISSTEGLLIAVLFIAAIMALVGYIGLLIGLWRLGTRYNNSLFKVGAIFAIFPILNLVGAILILVAAYSVREGLQRAPAAPVPYH